MRTSVLVAVACAVLAGCAEQEPSSSVISTYMSFSAPPITTTPPPEIEEDCGVVHRYLSDTVHAVRGSRNVDCAEARRVGELWYATPKGRGAGYYVEFENWKCTADTHPYLTRCVRTDSAVVFLQERN